MQENWPLRHAADLMVAAIGGQGTGIPLRVTMSSFGPVLLAAIAIGIAAYGLFCFARAKHLSR